MNTNRLYLDIETLPAAEDSFDNVRKLYEKRKNKDKVDFEQFLLGTSFDGTFGRILCVGYAENDDEVKVINGDGNEAGMLTEFWEIARNKQLFIGHNVMDFDLRFIYQRSIINNIKPSKELNFARYRNNPIFDTMREWTKWANSSVGLEALALSLGIPTPKDGIDGSQVFSFYKKGKVKEICDYCKRDVETTRLIYKRMTFYEQSQEYGQPEDFVIDF